MPKEALGCIQVERALCFCGECQVLVAWEEFGSCVIDSLLGLCSGWASWFSDADFYSVLVQRTISVPTYCTDSDLLDSSVFLKGVKKKFYSLILL